MIESHVVNFELSRRLHELGVRKSSIFFWMDFGIPGQRPMIECVRGIRPPESIKKYQAYTASEILEMLPSDCKIDGDICYLEIYKIDDIFYVQYVYDGIPYASIEDEKICNAAAKMPIYLIENKLVDVEDINK